MGGTVQIKKPNDLNGQHKAGPPAKLLGPVCFSSDMTISDDPQHGAYYCGTGLLPRKS